MRMTSSCGAGRVLLSSTTCLYVGDYANGKLYTLDPDTVTDNGTAITRMRRTPHATNSMLRMFHRSLTVVFQTGVNGMDAPTDEPQAMLRWIKRRRAYVE